MTNTGLPQLHPCQWPAPANVKAHFTTRRGGHSAPPFHGFNLAGHVGDRPADVAANRRLLRRHLPAEPCWLEQVHGTRVITAGETTAAPAIADGSLTRRRGVVCAVLTADCLPILMCDAAGTQVAAIHAGWRGLAAGVIETGLAAFPEPRQVHAWIGPAIGAAAFEIGGDVRDALGDHPSAPATAFSAGRDGHWHADLAQLARARLAHAGVDSISGGGWCTAREEAHFFSYRRDGTTGRQASLIWLD
ncbi:MAG: peptidoglycan editing factor PgeF [Gammaproteobacteria bacterium]|nr:peptidoglycan editing factor PgeF [Gammaproteobacteria bacterium]